MTGLAAFTPSLGRELGILGEAALFVRHALPALPARFRGKRTLLGEAALGAWTALPALAAGLRRETAVLRKAAFGVGDGLAAHARDLSLALCVHRGETAIRSPAVLSPAVSHHHSPHYC